MQVTIQELNFYNDLVKNKKALPIICPFDKSKEFSDIVITKIDDNDKVYFHCISCKSNFYPNTDMIQKIKGYISLAIS